MSLANEILDRWAPVLAGVDLRTGDKGRFEVEVDGEPIFSKTDLKRFPQRGEIVALLSPRLGRAPEWRSTGT